MDPGAIPEELQGLTEIEVHRSFLLFQYIVFVGSACIYIVGNVILLKNQDVLEFATRHPRNPSLLDILCASICEQSII